MSDQPDCIVIDKYGPFSMCWRGCTNKKHAYHNGLLPPHYPMPAIVHYYEFGRCLNDGSIVIIEVTGGRYDG